jgi:phage tail P2-like protein
MWKTIDIVPSSIRNDPQVIAACGSIDKELSSMYGCMGSVPGGLLFWPFVDVQEPPLLDILGWEMHVDIWAGWEGTLSTEKKRELINASIDWHRHKGTRYAVDQMLRVVFERGHVTEWYEYGGRPYYFRINFEGEISPEEWAKVKEAVYAVKNVRSWLDEPIEAIVFKQQLWHAIITMQKITTKIEMNIHVEP